ncbi:L-aspartate oxidase [Halanaeroarchaeum sulfurireducens]|uniref:L-aspartate oxidase n=1 Tax=Halanaeroarchaeum sulfurireducens TaxID=1604004 RepID=A0A0F7P9R3_9EURY|nr:FAD-dependent oxidoreductase [Halanaeroarchaeum sulfurireducens]AKH97522.1 L-aspartate oxidase [Halanaeroarchaeum sulfurireducens]ALG81918.1 L-aspartate oxidase [Halanaeroarchaeum sulfurireducens]
MTESTTDVLVIGSGIAGSAAALAAARGGAEVTIATKATRPRGASSWWAQGGIAISKNDREQFKRDILAASDDTADPAAVDILVNEANEVVKDVLRETLEVEFDRNGDSLDFGQEAAHSDERILHVDASTGKAIHVPFLNYLEARDNVEIEENTTALELIRHDGRVFGAMLEHEGNIESTFAGATILATGGIGELYPDSTNPAGMTGGGVAMAALAGASVADMEYVQFHPTVCVDADEQFLVSEAVRGEGAVLRNGDGERFMPEYHDDAELAPRDVVARSVESEREKTGEVRLDTSPLDFAEQFPDLVELCETNGIDHHEGIPVAPAEHFICGGIVVDERGRSSVDNLYAVGETARTGVHGANRLASTGLLEGLVWGLRAGEDAVSVAHRTPVATRTIETPELLDTDPELPDQFARDKLQRLRGIMAEDVGLERTPVGLKRAQTGLRQLKGEVDAYVRTRTSRSLYELRNATVTALLIAQAAEENAQSRGTHYLVEDPLPEATR